MRTIPATLALAFLLGCSAKQPKSGWEYRRSNGVYAASVYYRFGDPEGTTLIGSCKGEPQFMLAGGAWDAPRFTVTADDRSWTFPARQGEHGHYLPVELYIANQAMAHAKRRIAFQAGNWHREIRPSPPLTSFIADCS